MDRSEAVARDATHGLSAATAQFLPMPEGLIYLDGNSLGRPPADAATRADVFIREHWAGQLVRGWHEWLDRPTQVGDRLGRVALGAGPGQVVLCDSITVNLHKLLHAALMLDPQRRTVLVETAAFPTDRYVASALAAQMGAEVRWIASTDHGLDMTSLHDHLDDSVAVALLSHVDYRSGAITPIGPVTDLVHDAGALACWDLAHSAGVVPADLDAHGVDLAVGCTYKYLNGGPGAPAWLYVAERWQDQLVSGIAGWWGQHNMFDMDQAYTPAAGIRRFLAGTPGILGVELVDVALNALEDVGLAAVRRSGMSLTSMTMQLANLWLTPFGVEVVGPSDPQDRGSHVSLRHPQAWQITQALLAEHVIPDFRGPDLVRIGLAPLTTLHADVWDAMARLREIVRTGRHLTMPTQQSRVT